MQPGWYADPFTTGAVRWWDGSAWTQYSQWTQWVQQNFDAGRDLQDEDRAARHAMISVVVIAVVAVVSYFVSAATSGRSIHTFVNQVRAAQNNTGTGARIHIINAQLGFYGFSLVSFAAQILFWIWLHRAATIARRVGLPARRSTVWAWLGFVVPIVNLWFPYQVAADTLPPGDPARRIVGWWWAWWIVQTVLGIPIVVASYFSTTTAVVVAVVAAVAPIATAVKARAMVQAISAAHRHLVQLH